MIQPTRTARGAAAALGAMRARTEAAAAATPAEPGPATQPVQAATGPGPEPTGETLGMPTAAPESRPLMEARAELKAAAVIQVPLEMVRRVGAEAAIAYGVMQLIGVYDYQRIGAATGMRRQDTRYKYSLLVKRGYIKPVASMEEHLQRIGISAPTAAEPAAASRSPRRGVRGNSDPAPAGEGNER